MTEYYRRMRLLARYRLSRSTDTSTSFERQEEACQGYAKIHGHEIVDAATDPDVSGSVSPFDTPEFGEKLRHPEGYDGIIAWKLDRLGRTLFGLNDLFRWAQENDKVLICVHDNIDLSTWVGRLVAAVIAGVAEGELEAIKTRTRSSHAHLRTVGRWHGGNSPYGYRPVEAEKGWVLEPDPARSGAIRDIFDWILEKESPGVIARSLNYAMVPSPRGAKWSDTHVRRIVKARWPIGQTEHEGRPVIGEDGLPVQFSDPLVEYNTWQAAQAILADRSVPRIRANENGLLLAIAFCYECGSKLYVHEAARKDRPNDYRYWRCSNRVKRRGCTAPSIRSEDIEPLIVEEFLRMCGDRDIVEKIYVPGSDASERRARLTDGIETVRREKDLGLYEGDEAGYLRRVSELVELRNTLPAEDTDPRWVTQSTGVTYGQEWTRAETTSERRKVLLRSGLTVRMRVKPSVFHVDWRLDVLDRNLPTTSDSPSQAISEP